MSKSLFDKLQIGPLTLSNRLVRSATWEGMCDQQGNVTAQLIEHYRQLTRGGIGMIVSGYSYVREDGKQLPGTMGICNNSQRPGLQRLTDAVHREGGVVFCQLVHTGGQASSKQIGGQPLAPSAIDFAGYQDKPKEMTEADIKEIVVAFAEAAGRAKQAGFDGVQLHGAHGYLISQFLSPLCNQRQDAYGGTLEKRMTFLEEVFLAIRAAVGPGYPVTIKLTAADNIPGGLEPEDGVAIAKRLEELGIDAIEVSSGSVASGALGPVRTKIDHPDKEAYNADLSTMVKQAVSTPVAVVGGLRSDGVMQKLLETGSADLLALSRPLIREPNLPNLWRKEFGYTATCTSCNRCFRPGMQGDGIYCVIDKSRSGDPA